MIVEPIADSSLKIESDRLIVPIQHIDASPEPQVGDNITICYDGSREEAYPVIQGNVSRIKVVGDERQNALSSGIYS